MEAPPQNHWPTNDHAMSWVPVSGSPRPSLEQESRPCGVVQAGIFVRINSAAASLFGAASPDELLGRRSIDLIDGEAEASILTLRSAFTHGRVVGPIDFRLRRLDGAKVRVGVTVVPVVYGTQPAVKFMLHPPRSGLESQRVATRVRSCSANARATSQPREVAQKDTEPAEALQAILDALAHLIEAKTAPVWHCLIVAREPDEPMLRVLAAPSLPRWIGRTFSESCITGPDDGCSAVVNGGVCGVLRHCRSWLITDECGVTTGALLLCSDSAGPPTESVLRAATLGTRLVAVALERCPKERELAHTSEFLTALVDSSPVAILTIDDAGIHTMNRAAEELFPPPEVVDGKTQPRVPCEVYRAAKEVLREDGASIRDTETSIKLADGRIVHLSIAAAPLRRAGREMAIVIVSDITATKRAFEAERRLRDSERLAWIGELARDAAHEANNPINSILTLAHCLATDPTLDLPPQVRQDVALIEQEAIRAGEVMKDLLAFARNRKPVRPVDMNEIVRRAIATKRQVMRMAGVAVELDLAKSLPPILAAERQVLQVLINIVLNAKQALEGQGDGRIRIRSRVDAGDVIIEISDNGPGIAEDVLPHIFRPLYTTRTDGNGIGLSVSMSIVRELGGIIVAANDSVDGAVFTVRLPAHIDPDDAATGCPQVGGDTGHGREGDGVRVLLAEDEANLRRSLSQYLTRRGHVVTAVATGTEALRVLQAEACDVAVIDVRMPDMSGVMLWRLARLLRSETRVPTIFVTGDGARSDTAAFLEETGQPYLIKPFRPPELAALIDRVVAVACPG